MPTETQELVPQQYQDSLKAHTNLEARARDLALAIKDDVTYRTACDFRVTVDKQRKNWQVVIKPAVQAAHQAHQRVKDVENAVDLPLKNALTILDPQISRYRIEQENQRRLEQEKINRELKAQDDNRRLAEAEELQKSGKTEEAEAVLNAPVTAPEVILPSSTKVQGIQDRTYWSAEVFNLKLLCKAIAEGKADVSLVTPNDVALNGMARAMKTAMNAEWEPKGVRAVARTGIAGGR